MFRQFESRPGPGPGPDFVNTGQCTTCKHIIAFRMYIAVLQKKHLIRIYWVVSAENLSVWNIHPHIR